MKKIAFIGIGKVGFALADGLQQKGYRIVIGNDNPDSESVKDALRRNRALNELPVQHAIDQSEIVFLTVPFKAVESLSKAYDFSGKIVVDCTNPVGAGMTHALESKKSGSEFIAALLTDSRIVKAFTIYGFENLIDNTYPGYGQLKPAMLLSGDHNDSKEQVSVICEHLGWEAIDTGGLSQALHLEHLTLLWINMARVQGKGADFVWARLKR